MKKTVLRKYAQLIAASGVNVQPGQEVFIAADLDQPEFVKMLVEECYKRKAKKVVVDWSYQPLQKLHYRYRTLTTLSKLDNYEEARWQHYVDTIPCRIYLLSEDPDGLKGINQEKMAKSQQRLYPVIKKYRDQIENKYQWCIAAVPGAAWAKKLFPELRTSQAIEKLWALIFDVCRVSTGDPVTAWKEHVARTKARRDRMNELNLDRIRMTSANGTDLTVGLAEDATWEGASSKTEGGIEFIANVPTEEVFCAPHRDRVDGRVYGTKPYAYNGQLIEGWHVTFQNGKVVEHGAEKNAELLAELLTTDENANRIGEIALVPASSPINRSGVLFYNTLFDENAACHIAFGDGYPTNIKGGSAMSRDELLAKGLNSSAIHEDVMVGAPDTHVVGVTKSGEEITIFENGEWAF